MTISAWLDKATKQIDRLDAELILLNFLQASDRSYLIAHAEDELPGVEAINAQLSRRSKGEPLAYILGYRDFYGRRFFVTPDVLVPRPETEDIIDLVKDIQPGKILDVGTGSGCIAITLALELPNAQIDAIDISDEALRQAQKNATHHKVKINFHKSDLLKDFRPEPNTLIVANLPYVDIQWDWLNHEVLDYEPQVALYAEQDGLTLIYRLINQYPSNAAGLILEADPCQHQAIVEYAKEHGLKLQKKLNFILFFK